TVDHGKSFTQVALPIGQMYHLAVDNQVPYWIYSNRQDNGTMRGPSTAPEAATGGRGGVAGAGGRGGRGGDTSAVRDTARGRAGVVAGRGRGRGSDTTAARRDTSLARGDSAEGGGRGGGLPGTSTWDHGLGGCESGFTLPDPTDADIVWASCY